MKETLLANDAVDEQCDVTVSAVVVAAVGESFDCKAEDLACDARHRRSVKKVLFSSQRSSDLAICEQEVLKTFSSPDLDLPKSLDDDLMMRQWKSTNSSDRSLASRLWSAGKSTHSMAATMSVSGRSHCNSDYGEGSEETASFRKRRKSKHMKGEIVEIDDACDPLPMQAFEIDDSMQLTTTEALKPSYGFTRSARKSILLNLGLSFHAAALIDDVGDSSGEFIDPYTKASDRVCMENYMGIVIGYGCMTLPSVLADCGWVLGLGGICVFGCLNTFWICRLIQVPMLVRQNLQTYGAVARACCKNRFIQGIAVLMIWWTWYGQVILAYYNILYYSLHHRVQRQSDLWGFIMEVIIAVILLPLSFRTSVKELQTHVRIGLKAMGASLLVVLACSIVHGATNFKEIKYTPINTDLQQLARGLQNVGVAFTGLGILPYVVSEMLHPENARKVMTEASWKIMLFFLMYASVGYFGWGDLVNISVAKSIEREQSAYAYAAIGMDVAIIARCVSTYPIFFLPLFREMEAYFELEDSPPVSLGLPWAIVRQARLKAFLKVVVVCSSVVVYRFCPNYHFFLNIMNIPTFLVQIIMPSLFSILAVRIYHSRFASDKDQTDRSIFGTSGCWQVCVILVLAVVSFAFGILLLVGNVDEMVQAMRYGMGVYKSSLK